MCKEILVSLIFWIFCALFNMLLALMWQNVFCWCVNFLFFTCFWWKIGQMNAKKKKKNKIKDALMLWLAVLWTNKKKPELDDEQKRRVASMLTNKRFKWQTCRMTNFGTRTYTQWNSENKTGKPEWLSFLNENVYACLHKAP